MIAKVPTDMSDKPRIPVHIFNCGELKETQEERQKPNIDQDVIDDSEEEDNEEEQMLANNAFIKY